MSIRKLNIEIYRFIKQHMSTIKPRIKHSEAWYFNNKPKNIWFQSLIYIWCFIYIYIIISIYIHNIFSGIYYIPLKKMTCVLLTTIIFQLFHMGEARTHVHLLSPQWQVDGSNLLYISVHFMYISHLLWAHESHVHVHFPNLGILLSFCPILCNVPWAS